MLSCFSFVFKPFCSYFFERGTFQMIRNDWETSFSVITPSCPGVVIDNFDDFRENSLFEKWIWRGKECFDDLRETTWNESKISLFFWKLVDFVENISSRLKMMRIWCWEPFWNEESLSSVSEWLSWFQNQVDWEIVEQQNIEWKCEVYQVLDDCKLDKKGCWMHSNFVGWVDWVKYDWNWDWIWFCWDVWFLCHQKEENN